MLLLDLLMLLGGLALLLGGGEALVRGAVTLATKLGVPTLIVGLTVVAFGTSTPELVVNLIAAHQGKSDVGFGNVVGSNIANISLLMGITALVRPILVQNSVVRREIPMMLLTTVAAVIMAEDVRLNGRGSNSFDRDDGLVLLLLFGVYIYYLVNDALSQRSATLTTTVEEPAAKPSGSLAAAIGLIVGGLLALIAGGHLTVVGATALATAAGVPEVVISLTLVAVGTSLPELITCVAAARRGESDLAIGNLIGSNIYNLTFVFGITAAVSPIPVPDPGGIIDLLVMLAFSALVLPLGITQRVVSRGEGALMLALYAGYVGWLVMRPAAG